MSAAQLHVRHMLDRIELSYSEPITLHSLASELHRQAAYLGAMFRREVGVSMHQCLTSVRLDHAAALVRDGVKVEAVALLVGYRSKKNFYRQFKRRFGMTPFAHGTAARDDVPTSEGVLISAVQLDDLREDASTGSRGSVVHTAGTTATNPQTQ